MFFLVVKARGSFQAIRELGREALNVFVEETAATMIEEEALAVLRNPHCDPSMVSRIAHSRVASRYAIRSAIVGHRRSPLPQAMRFVPHLKWHDLLRYSTDVRIMAGIRRLIEEQMKIRMVKLTLGEKISTSKACSSEIAKTLFRETDPRVTSGLLNNPRITEQLLALMIEREELTGDQLAAIASHPRWKQRYPLRKSIARCPVSPRSVAAAQLLHLTVADLRELLKNPKTSLYLQRCVERLGLLDDGKSRNPGQD